MKTNTNYWKITQNNFKCIGKSAAFHTGIRENSGMYGCMTPINHDQHSVFPMPPH